MLKKILVAIDSGGPAAAAVEAAGELAVQIQAKIVVLHVVDSAATALEPSRGRRHEELYRLGKELLESVYLPPLLSAERVLLEGDPAETIISTAGELGADLIIIGTDSRGRLANFLLGTTADAVIRRAPCPVMTVPARNGTRNGVLMSAAAART